MSQIPSLLRWLTLSSLSVALLTACPSGGGGTLPPPPPPPPPPPLEGVQFDLKVGQADVQIDSSLSSRSLSSKTVQSVSRYALQQVGAQGTLSARETQGRFVNLLWRLTQNGQSVGRDLKLKVASENVSQELTHKAGLYWDDNFNFKTPSNTISMTGTLPQGDINTQATVSRGSTLTSPSITKVQLNTLGLYLAFNTFTPSENILVSLFKDPGGDIPLERVAGGVVHKGINEFSTLFDQPLNSSETYVLLMTVTSWDTLADRRKPLLRFVAPSSTSIFGEITVRSSDSDPVVISAPSEVGITAVVGQTGDTDIVLRGGDYKSSLVYDLELLDPSGTFTLEGDSSGIAQPEQSFLPPSPPPPKIRASCTGVGKKSAKLVLRTNANALKNREIPLILNCVAPIQAKALWMRDALIGSPRTWSPDGSQFAMFKTTLDGIQHLEIRRSSDGNIVRNVVDLPLNQSLLAWSPLGNLIATINNGDNASLRLWNVSDGSLKSATPLALSADNTYREIDSLSFSPNGQKILVNGLMKDGSSIVFDINAQNLYSFGLGESVRPAKWSSDGKKIATNSTFFDRDAGRYKSTIKIYSSENGSILKEFTPPILDGVKEVSWASNDDLILIENFGSPIARRFSQSGNELQKMDLLERNNNGSHFYGRSNADEFIFGDISGFSVYSWSKGSATNTFKVFKDQMLKSVKESPNGTDFHIILDTSTLVLDSKLKYLRRLGAHIFGASSLYGSDLNGLTSIGTDGLSLTFSVDTGAERFVWQAKSFASNTNWILPNPVGSRLLLGGEGDLVYLWNPETRKNETAYALPFVQNAYTNVLVRWSPDGDKIAFLKVGGLFGSESEVNYAIFKVSGDRLLEGNIANPFRSGINSQYLMDWASNSKSIRLLDRVLDLDKNRELSALKFVAPLAAMSPDGRNILSQDISYFGPGLGLRLISSENGQTQLSAALPKDGTLADSVRPVLKGIAWSPDSSRALVLIALEDWKSNVPLYKIVIIGGKNLRPLQTPLDNLAAVSTLSWFRQGVKEYLAIGFQDGSIRLLTLE